MTQNIIKFGLSIGLITLGLGVFTNYSSRPTPMSADTIFPTPFTTVNIKWVGNVPVAYLTPEHNTRYSETDLYVMKSAEETARTMYDAEGFIYTTLVVPTPYAAFPIDHFTGRMK